MERTGRFTGELAEPPLTADGRASLAARLAADHDVDLADCHAYGDSLADLPLLELVGHPHAINPDFRLVARGAAAAAGRSSAGRTESGRGDAGAAAITPSLPQLRRRARAGAPAAAGALALDGAAAAARSPGPDWVHGATRS